MDIEEYKALTAKGAYLEAGSPAHEVMHAAAAEARNPCDISVVHHNRWQTMTFNVFEMGSEENVAHALQVLSAGGVVLEPLHALPWSKCCATVIDRYGVCWWLSL